MALTKEQKDAAKDAFKVHAALWGSMGGYYDGQLEQALYAALEAVLAMAAPPNGPCSVCGDGGYKECPVHGPAQEKTLEERVTVKHIGASELVFVYLDGEDVYKFCRNMTQSHAEIYRLGLIAKLRAEGIGK